MFVCLKQYGYAFFSQSSTKLSRSLRVITIKALNCIQSILWGGNVKCVTPTWQGNTSNTDSADKKKFNDMTTCNKQFYVITTKKRKKEQ